MSVNTVQGKISAEKLGIVLPHEHLLIDVRNQFRPFSEVSKNAVAEGKVDLSNISLLRRNPMTVRDNLLMNDVALAEEEAMQFKKAGGDTIVDLTNLGLGRDVKALRAISRAVGIHIIAGCGYYYHDTHPLDMNEKTVEDLKNSMLADIVDGIDGTGIKAGVIGELGMSEVMHPDEKKVLLAAAKVQSITGLGIQVHIFPWNRTGKYPLGLDVLDILEAGGADLRKVSINHVDVAMEIKFDYCLAIVKRGAIVEVDNFGHEFYVNREDRKWLPGPFATDYQRVVLVKSLIDAGFLANILLSNDICHKCLLHQYGGWGYDHILNNIIPMMADVGINGSEVMTMMKENTKRFLDDGKNEQ